MPDPFRSEDLRVLFGKRFWQTRVGRAIAKHRSRMDGASIDSDQILDEPCRFLMLWRPAMGEGGFGGSPPRGTLCIRSLWKGYLETEEEKRLAALLADDGVEQRHLHASGHATQEDLVKFLKEVDAERIVVVHSERPAALRNEFANVVSTGNGKTIEV